MHQPKPAFPPSSRAISSPDATMPAARQALWLAILVAASVAFTLGLACAMPFAALGSAAALTLPRRDALLLTGAAWFANQLVGFVLLDYPWTVDTLAWGVALGIVAVLTTASQQWFVPHLDRHGGVLVAVASFVAAFAVYEGGLFVVAATLLGATEDFAPAIVARVLEINAGAFAALLVLHRLGTAVGLAAMPPNRFAATERHA